MFCGLGKDLRGIIASNDDGKVTVATEGNMVVFLGEGADEVSTAEGSPAEGSPASP